MGRGFGRNVLGPRYGEKMGRLCHSAITAAYRDRREEYDRLVHEIYQMIDTIEQETFGAQEKKDADKVQAPPALAPASEPVEEAGGDPEAAPEEPRPAAGNAGGEPDPARPKPTRKRAPAPRKTKTPAKKR